MHDDSLTYPSEGKDVTPARPAPELSLKQSGLHSHSGSLRVAQCIRRTSSSSSACSPHDSIRGYHFSLSSCHCPRPDRRPRRRGIPCRPDADCIGPFCFG
jgi:hypothetical protein